MVIQLLIHGFRFVSNILKQQSKAHFNETFRIHGLIDVRKYKVGNCYSQMEQLVLQQTFPHLLQAKPG